MNGSVCHREKSGWEISAGMWEKVIAEQNEAYMYEDGGVVITVALRQLVSTSVTTAIIMPDSQSILHKVQIGHMWYESPHSHV